MVQLFWKTVWQFLKKLNIKLPFDPVILLLEDREDGTSGGEAAPGLPVSSPSLPPTTEGASGFLRTASTSQMA